MSAEIGVIEVNKITISHKVKSKSGSPVVNPHSTEEVRDEETKIQNEFIRTEGIKSFRAWGKTQEQEAIEGDITIIYFKEDPLHISERKEDDPKKDRKRKTTPVMYIHENHKEFARRLGAIMIPIDEQG